MKERDFRTKIQPDGLRYKSKTAGSIFNHTSGFGSATMSCFLCGKHRPRSMMESRRFFGKSQSVCTPNCKTLEQILSNQQPLGTDK